MRRSAFTSTTMYKGNHCRKIVLSDRENAQKECMTKNLDIGLWSSMFVVCKVAPSGAGGAWRIISAARLPSSEKRPWWTAAGARAAAPVAHKGPITFSHPQAADKPHSCARPNVLIVHWCPFRWCNGTFTHHGTERGQLAVQAAEGSAGAGAVQGASEPATAWGKAGHPHPQIHGQMLAPTAPHGQPPHIVAAAALPRAQGRPVVAAGCWEEAAARCCRTSSRALAPAVAGWLMLPGRLGRQRQQAGRALHGRHARAAPRGFAELPPEGAPAAAWRALRHWAPACAQRVPAASQHCGRQHCGAEGLLAARRRLAGAHGGPVRLAAGCGERLQIHAWARDP